MTVYAAALGGDLYRVSTPAGSALVPVARFKNGQLRVSTRGSGRPATLTIRLSESVTWSLKFSGGATRLATNFRVGKLSAIALVAGDSRGTLTLPRPAGTVPILEDGGLSNLTVTVPGDVPTRVQVDGGVAHVSFDGATRTGVAAGTVFSSPGWRSARDRYELRAKGGLSSLQVLADPV